MREMKDSGIEWIGEIPKDWKTTKLKYTYNNSNVGEAIDKDNYGEGSIIFYTAGMSYTFMSYDGFPEWKYTQSNDILLARNGTPYVYLPQNGAAYSDHIIRIDIKKEYDKRFLRYSLQRAIEAVAVETVSISTWSVSLWKEQILPLPNYESQRKLADYLDEKCAKIDAIIEKQQEIIEKLKEYKLSVITESVTKGLNPNVEMKKSGIRKLKRIPYNWNEIKITRMLDNSNSYPMGDGDHGLIKTDDYKEEGIPYIRVQNLGWGTELQLDNVIYISEEDHERIKSSELHPNDILFCKTGATIGKTGMVPESIPIANTTSHVGKITLDKKYNSRFVFYFLSSHIGYVQFWDIACLKSTRPELAIEETKAIRIPIPRKRTDQDEIVKYLDEKCRELDFGISKKEKVIDKLEEYKKSLIYEVVTGKREV